MGHLASSGIYVLLPFIQITINLLETDKVTSRQPVFTAAVVTIPHSFFLRQNYQECCTFRILVV